MRLAHARRWCRAGASRRRGLAVVAAVDRAARLCPWRAACLEQSLAAVFVAALARRRLTWCLGVRTDPYRFHAWVEADGRPVAKEVRWNQAYYRLARGSDFRARRVGSASRAASAYQAGTGSST
nr:lasso peptide biosynthesis B2 protein [Nonomuraea sp. MG754425]